ncbi:TPA: hypothetical protein ACWQGI_003563 [Escherichia coli]|uniref:hypothetical protein n=1 Tax=Escherichia coli TaxID=562 RepID=UPI001DB5307B|nr:hypothetical protein [Escherichia coli]EIL6287860.1 hypothetical protein [Escherichia coli]MBB7841229.1 hypothetical protein [Escherichia coli]MDI6923668.1 hypothetical protein [Escherichia coli]MDZ6451395.1 hypothetical protein [Escherichia coli]WHN43013.1 hypothetical protein QBY76_09215 [Escherichia coli]
MKEKQTSASFDITAIFLLVMQVVVGASKALHWIARRCASLEYNRFDDKKLAQEDKKSPCANALLQVTNTI